MLCKKGLFTFLFEILLKGLQNVQIAQRSSFRVAFVDLGNLTSLLLLFGFSHLLLIFLGSLPSLRMGEMNLLSLLGEVNHHKVKNFVHLSLRLVFFQQVAVEGKALDAVRQSHHGTLVVHAGNRSLVDRTHSEDGLKDIPRILLQLLVTQAETTVLGIHFQNNHVDRLTNFGELGRMFDFLGPGEVRDVDQAVNTLFELNEDTEVGMPASKHSQ